MKNGMYRNHAGAELHVTGAATRGNGWLTLGGIYTAEARDGLFGITNYLVTEQSMNESGYTFVAEEGESRG